MPVVQAISKNLEYHRDEISQHFKQIAQPVLAMGKSFFSFGLWHLVAACFAAAAVV